MYICACLNSDMERTGAFFFLDKLLVLYRDDDDDDDDKYNDVYRIFRTISRYFFPTL